MEDWHFYVTCDLFMKFKISTERDAFEGASVFPAKMLCQQHIRQLQHDSLQKQNPIYPTLCGNYCADYRCSCVATSMQWWLATSSPLRYFNPIELHVLMLINSLSCFAFARNCFLWLVGKGVAVLFGASSEAFVQTMAKTSIYTSEWTSARARAFVSSMNIKLVNQ